MVTISNSPNQLFGFELPHEVFSVYQCHWQSESANRDENQVSCKVRFKHFVLFTDSNRLLRVVSDGGDTGDRHTGVLVLTWALPQC